MLAVYGLLLARSVTCSQCGLETSSELCVYHHASAPEGWAQENRIMCDFFHRGRIPVRLAEADRAEEVVTPGDMGMF